MRMLQRVLTSGLVVFFAGQMTTACKDKEVLCTHRVYSIPSSPIFYKLPLSAGDTVLVRSYMPGTSTLLRTETIPCDSVRTFNDTTYNSSARWGFGQIVANTDYEIEIPSLQKHWQVKNLHYSGDSLVIYTSKNCGPGRTFVRPADSVTVDQVQTGLISLGVNTNYVLLR
jgi:hypothetical protein